MTKTTTPIDETPEGQAAMARVLRHIASEMAGDEPKPLVGDGTDLARYVLQTAIEDLVIAGVEPDVIDRVAATLFRTR